MYIDKKVQGKIIIRQINILKYPKKYIFILITRNIIFIHALLTITCVMEKMFVMLQKYIYFCIRNNLDT